MSGGACESPQIFFAECLVGACYDRNAHTTLCTPVPLHCPRAPRPGLKAGHQHCTAIMQHTYHKSLIQ